MTNDILGWIGVGLGKRGMTEVDMHVVEFINKNDFKVHDMYSFGKFAPKLDTQIGGRDDIFNATYKFIDNQYVVNYLRKLEVGDKYDFSIPIGREFNISVAWGNTKKMTYHGPDDWRKLLLTIYDNEEKEEIDKEKNEDLKLLKKAAGDLKTHPHIIDNINEMNSIKILQSTQNNTNHYAKTFTIHGLLMFTFWTIFNNIGIIYARYFRSNRNWVIIHQICNGGTVLVSVIMGLWAMATIDYKQNTKYLPDTNRYHHNMGKTILIISILQMVCGYIIYLFGTKKYMTVETKNWYKLVHKYVGLFLVIITKLELLLGFLIFWPEYYWVMLINMIIEGVGVYILESRYR